MKTSDHSKLYYLILTLCLMVHRHCFTIKPYFPPLLVMLLSLSCRINRIIPLESCTTLTLWICRLDSQHVCLQKEDSNWMFPWCSICHKYVWRMPDVWCAGQAPLISCCVLHVAPGISLWWDWSTKSYDISSIIVVQRSALQTVGMLQLRFY